MLCLKGVSFSRGALYPVSRTYPKLAEAYFRRADLKHQIVENPKFASFIHKTLEYLDSFQDRHDVFLNGDHLNEKGRRLFAHKISQGLVVLT